MSGVAQGEEQKRKVFATWLAWEGGSEGVPKHTFPTRRCSVSCQGNMSSASSTSLLKGHVQIRAKHYYSIYSLTWSKFFTAEHDPKRREAQPGNQLRPLQSTLQLPASTGMDPLHHTAHMLLQRKMPIDTGNVRPAAPTRNQWTAAAAQQQQHSSGKGSEVAAQFYSERKLQ